MCIDFLLKEVGNFVVVGWTCYPLFLRWFSNCVGSRPGGVGRLRVCHGGMVYFPSWYGDNGRDLYFLPHVDSFDSGVLGFCGPRSGGLSWERTDRFVLKGNRCRICPL